MKRLLWLLWFLATPAMAQNYVGGFNYSIATTPTVQNASYSASNAMGGLQTIQVFRNENQPTGILTDVWIASKGGNTVAMTVYIFDTKPTASTCTDKSAFSLGAADVAKLAILPISLTPAAPQGSTPTIAESSFSKSIKNNDTTLTKNVYVCIVANGTVTPGTTTDLVLKLALAQD